MCRARPPIGQGSGPLPELDLIVRGIAIGIAGALAATGVIGTLLFGVSRADPLTYAGVVGLLGLVALVACAVPAWRAARVDPATTLRTE